MCGSNNNLYSRLPNLYIPQSFSAGALKGGVAQLPSPLPAPSRPARLTESKEADKIIKVNIVSPPSVLAGWLLQYFPLANSAAIMSADWLANSPGVLGRLAECCNNAPLLAG